jgi:hypothetical protein
VTDDTTSLDHANLEILVDHRDDVIVLCLVGEMDLSNAARINDAFDNEALPSIRRVFEIARVQSMLHVEPD